MIQPPDTCALFLCDYLSMVVTLTLVVRTYYCRGACEQQVYRVGMYMWVSTRHLG